MNFSEFKRWLGADPRSEDAAFRAARAASPEHEQANREALAFEDKLDRAVQLPAPDDLVTSLKEIPVSEFDEQRVPRRWAPLALAASLLVAVGAAVITWQSSHQWDSVDEYLADHYRHDGPALLARVDSVPVSEVQELLAAVGAQAAPALADIVGVIKYCPTPDGKGVHMVLNTGRGPVTLIYMPETAVIDHERVHFDDVEAVLVSLPKGSAAVMGAGISPEPELLALVQESIATLPGSS